MILELPQSWLSQELLFFISIIATSALLCLAYSIMGRFTPRLDPPVRHALLLAALVLIVGSPLFHGTFSTFGWTAIQLTKTESQIVPLSEVPDAWERETIFKHANQEFGPSVRRKTDATMMNDHSSKAYELPMSRPGAGQENRATFLASRNIFGLIVGVWSLGVFFGIVRLGFGIRRIRRLTRNSQEVGHAEIANLAQQCAQKIALRKTPRIFESAWVVTPISVGCLSPRVILPSHRASLSTCELESLLLHEFAHIQRGDLWVGVFARLSQIAYWWNPCLFWVTNRLAMIREIICDDIVAQNVDSSSDYAATLVDMASAALKPRTYVFALGILDGHSSQFSNRIRRLLEPQRSIVTRMNRTALIPGIGFAAIALSLVFATSIGVREVKAKDSTNSPEKIATEQTNENIPEKSERKSARERFVPKRGLANKTHWTALSESKIDKKNEFMMAHVTLEGEFPVRHAGEDKDVFRFKMLAGSDSSLNIRLSRLNETHRRVLHRDQPMTWKIDGLQYRITFASTYVASDQKTESPSATIIITSQLRSTRKKADSETTPPSQATDNSRRNGGSDMLRNLRASSDPILAEMVNDFGYGLEPRQNLLRVPPPFAPLRMDYYRISNPTQFDAIPAGPSAMSFFFEHGKLRNWGMTFGSGDEGYSLSGVLNVVANIKTHMIEGDKELLSRPIPGDWVIRKKQSGDVLISELERILRDELKWPVRLELKLVPRRVYVATGNYKIIPLPGEKAHGVMNYTDRRVITDRVHIFGTKFVPKSGAGGGTGDVDEFLLWLGRWIQFPIVNELESGPKNEISWRLHERISSSASERDKDLEKRAVLENISKQTNIVFKKDKRRLKKLFVYLDN